MIWYLIGIWIRSGSGLFDKKAKPMPVAKKPTKADISDFELTNDGIRVKPKVKFKNEVSWREDEINL